MLFIPCGSPVEFVDYRLKYPIRHTQLTSLAFWHRGNKRKLHFAIFILDEYHINIKVHSFQNKLRVAISYTILHGSSTYW